MPHFARWAVTLFVCGSFAGVAPGCGSDDENEPARPPEPSEAGSAGASGSGGDGGTGGAGGEAGSGGEAGEPEAIDAFDAWREMQGMLRQSPDHWPARAAALVAAKDAEGLFELVRDDIALIPGRGGFYGAATSRRFGARAALRGGMGTMRERADLLRELLDDAGFEAEVYVGRPEADFDIEDSLAHAPNRTLQLSYTAAQFARWKAALPPHAEDFEISPLDPDGALVDAVVEAVDGAGVTAAGATDIDWSVTEIPFVRATIGGDEVDLNPNVAGAAFGDARVEDADLAPEAGGLDTINVRLSIARASAPGTEIPLVEKSWTADELVGRTVTGAFVTPYSFVEAAATSARDAQTFVPVLEVKGPDLTDAEGQELSAVGETITRGGEVVTIDDSGELSIGGEVVSPPPSDPARLAAVESVAAHVDGAAFPQVEVSVALRDGAGRLVGDLSADAFRVEEGGEEVQAVLRRSRAPSPRVILLFDRSTSLPPVFLDEAAATGHAIAEALFEAVPDVQVQVAGMDFGGPRVAGAFAASVADVDAQLEMLGGAASEVWTNIGAPGFKEASAVVLISDFIPDDMLTDDIARTLADGPPVLAVAVGESNTEVADQIAALSSGARVDGVDAQGVAASVAEFVSERDAYTYRLVYRANREGSAEREVRVLVDEARLEATGDYAPPEMPAPLPAVSGVFLTVGINGREVRRLIAGTESSPPSPQAVEEADAMLFGRVVLGTEAGPPSLSQKLDEHMGERLWLEPAWDAAKAGDAAKTLKELQRSRSRTPANLRFAFSAGRDELEGPATYPDGVSTALYVERPIWGVGFRRSLDWLPLAPRRTALRDPEAAFRTTLRRTAYLSAIEAARFDESTLSLLRGETLASYEAEWIDLDLGSAWYGPAQAYGGRTLVAPSDGGPIAFFAVDPATGDVIGGLPDGTGGAVAAEVEATLQQIERILSLAERAGSVGGFNGISVWVQLERTKAQIVGAVTILFGEGGEVPDIGSILADAAAGAAEDAATGEIPGWDEAFQPAEDLGNIFDVFGLITGAETPDVGPPSFF